MAIPGLPQTLQASPCVNWFGEPIFGMSAHGHELGSEDKPQKNTWVNLNIGGGGGGSSLFLIKNKFRILCVRKGTTCMHYQD